MILISDEYKALNEQLHAENKHYGGKGYKRAVDIWQNFIKPYELYSILDYGCGKGTLADALDKLFSIPIIGYDPCVEKFSKRPKEGIFDGVICMDMLEHCEPDLLDNVLRDIKEFGNDNALYYFNVALVPSNKHLPDGRNAHLIVETKEWWARKFIECGFKIKKGVTEKYYKGDDTPDDKLGFFNCILRKQESGSSSSHDAKRIDEVGGDSSVLRQSSSTVFFVPPAGSQGELDSARSATLS